MCGLTYRKSAAEENGSTFSYVRTASAPHAVDIHKLGVFEGET